MASSESEWPWPRDHHADANPGITRKRQRLSEELTLPPDPGTGSVVVEALATDTISPDSDAVIELHSSDSDMVMEASGVHFDIYPGAYGLEEPLSQVVRLHNQVCSDPLLDPAIFIALTYYLDSHLEATRYCESWPSLYMEGHDFFGKLGKTISYLLARDELFDVLASDGKLERLQMSSAVQKFFSSLMELSARIVTCLPNILERRPARRDSGRIHVEQHNELFYYVVLLAQVFTSEQAPALFKHLLGYLDLAAVDIDQERMAVWRRHTHLGRSLVQIFQKLSHSHHEFATSWDSVQAVLRIVNDFRHLNAAMRKDLAQIMDVMHSQILPNVRLKHPRTLPEQFHVAVIQTGGTILKQIVEDATVESVELLFNDYVKSGYDALIPEDIPQKLVLKKLDHVSHEDRSILSELLCTAWKLQALKSFLFSDIMDIRSCGISSISSELVRIWHTYGQTPQGHNHPLIQYISRFLRHNELTKYIFGPDSHANLVSHSTDIIAFLAVSHAFTDAETDIIWAACVNSVEAEFVRASFSVVTGLLRFLDFERLLYLINRYTITPNAKIGKDAVEPLADIFKWLQICSDTAKQPEQRLAIAFVSMEILKKFSECSDNPALQRARDIAHCQLRMFWKPPYTTADRLDILSRCLSDFIGLSPDASTSAEIMLSFLRSGSIQDSAIVVNKLPLQTFTAEFKSFIKRLRYDTEALAQNETHGITTRLEIIIRLSSLARHARLDDLVEDIYGCCFENLAVSYEARDRAWLLLSALDTSQTDSAAPFVRRFLARLLTTKIPYLSTDYVTITLLRLMYTSMLAQMQSNTALPLSEALLDSAMWQKIVEVARQSDDRLVQSTSMLHICHLLFQMPAQTQDLSLQKDDVLSCQAKFTRQQIDSLQDLYVALDVGEQKKKSGISRILDLLSAVLVQSNNTSPLLGAPVCSELYLDDVSANEICHYTLELYTGQTLKRVTLCASKKTTVGELFSCLPAITGSAQNRIVFSGRMLQMHEKSEAALWEIGGPSTGVIQISPKYHFTDDLSKALTAPSVVELEILLHFDQFYMLLEGPPEIAFKTFCFLKKVRPSTAARLMVTSPEINEQTVFPAYSPWKTAFSVFVLELHFRDFCKLGVLDDHFQLRSIHLLVSLLQDKERELPNEVYRSIVACLHRILEERPTTPFLTPAIDDPAGFVSCLVEKLQVTLVHDAHSHVHREEIASWTYRVLLEACRVQPSVAQRFTEHDQSSILHEHIFLDESLSKIHQMIVHFCEHPGVPVIMTDAYLEWVLDMVPVALHRISEAHTFFDFATGILDSLFKPQADEEKIRRVANDLTSDLMQYQHCEDVRLPLLDPAMLGLLRLSIKAIKLLKNFGKPLHLDSACVEIYGKLLFPPTLSSSTPLLHAETRELAYNIVRMTCEMPETLPDLIYATVQAADASEEYGVAGRLLPIRPPHISCGLENLGMTCYMNSLIQQLFANVHFRIFILGLSVESPDSQNCLHGLQTIFAWMQDGAGCYVRPSDLIRALKLQTDVQEDVHGFYETFLSTLEAEMPDAESKLALSRFFSGKLITQIKGECGHVSSRDESFVDLAILVKNKRNLAESLEEYVQGEPMEGSNKYKCLACSSDGKGRLVNAMRRACPQVIPDNLTICLKRFQFEAMLSMDDKVNDQFEFPQTIDMATYCLSRLEDATDIQEPDIFELVGVIVHQGSLTFGHYWSYALLRNTGDPATRVWIRAEDHTVVRCEHGIDDVKKGCFGGVLANGQERVDNAYVLFYQRKSSVEDTLGSVRGPTYDPASGQVLPPRVHVPDHIAARLWKDNVARHLTGQFLEGSFATFFEWLLTRFLEITEPLSEPSSSSESDGNLSRRLFKQIPNMEISSVGTQFAAVVIFYLRHIAFQDNYSAFKQSRSQEMLARLATRPSMADHLLHHFLKDDVWVETFCVGGESLDRSGGLPFLKQCLMHLYDEKPDTYYEIVRRITNHMALIMLRSQKELICIDFSLWLGFSGWLAMRGPVETADVLDAGLLVWTLRQLGSLHESLLHSTTQDVFTKSLRDRPIAVSAMYTFISDILDEHVVIGHDCYRSDQDRFTTEQRVLLNEEEVLLLGAHESGVRPFLWLRAAVFASCLADPFQPIRLLRLLMDPTKSPDVLRDNILTSLRVIVSEEDERLSELLRLITAFCSICRERDTEGESVVIVKDVTASINLWECYEHRFLGFITETYACAPQAIAANLEACVWVLLDTKQKSSRKRYDAQQKLADWLSVFLSEPLQTSLNATSEALRAEFARKFTRSYSHILTVASTRGRACEQYRPLIQIMEATNRYVSVLREHIRTTDRSVVGPQLLAQYDEMTGTASQLEAVIPLVRNWGQGSMVEVSNEMEMLASETSDMSGGDEDDDDDVGAWEDGDEGTQKI